jgi:hypothetical protein
MHHGGIDERVGSAADDVLALTALWADAPPADSDESLGQHWQVGGNPLMAARLASNPEFKAIAHADASIFISAILQKLRRQKRILRRHR